MGTAQKFRLFNMEIWKNCSNLLRVTNLRAFVMLLRLGFPLGICLTGHGISQGIFAVVGRMSRRGYQLR
jgi:hypothetical protein